MQEIREVKNDHLRRKEVMEPGWRIILDLVEGAPSNMGMVGIGAFYWGRGRREAERDGRVCLMASVE